MRNWCYKNKNKKKKPHATHAHGKLIYFNDKLFKFGGGDYRARSNEFSCFDLKKSMWNKLKLISNEIPQPRFGHKMIKYKHYAIIFGGNNKC